MNFVSALGEHGGQGDFGMTGAHFEALTPRFQRIALDASTNTAMLGWAERLFFLSAAGEKHETWRKAYASRFMNEQVPQWSSLVNAVIELWRPAEITSFEMAAVYTMSDDMNWRMAGELWCVASGHERQLASFWADPVGYSGDLVGQALERLERLAG